MQKYVSFSNGKYNITTSKKEWSFEIDDEEKLAFCDVTLCEKLIQASKTTENQRYKLSYIEALTSHLKEIGAIKSYDAIFEVKNYIDENLGEKLTDDILSEKFFLSKYYLIRSFKKAFGVTPIKYHENKRMERAKELLSSTDMPTKKIGELLGYFDDIYFARVFKKNCGMSLSEYRKESKNKSDIIKESR